MGKTLLKKGCSPNPFPKTFNDFSVMRDKLPLLKNVREFRKRVWRIILSRECSQRPAVIFAVHLRSGFMA